MTELMEKAIAAVKKLPQERQDEIAQVILFEANDIMQLTAEEEAAIREGLTDTQKGVFASDNALENHLARLRAS